MTHPRPWPLLALLPVLLTAGCARPQRTADQVAGRHAPYDLQRGPVPPGGVTMSSTGGGAGGSAAGGAQNIVGRVGGAPETPTVTTPHGDDINVNTGHRMSPTTGNAANNGNSDGSGTGDTGNPLPPTVSLAAPPDPKAKPQFAPAGNEPPSLGPAGKLPPRSNPANSLPGGLRVNAQTQP